MTDLTVIMPCYNEDERLVSQTVSELQSYGCQVIVVDDGATMNLPSNSTYQSYFPHRGYGYALKYGIRQATTPLICTMDSDGQHRPEDVKRLYQIYKLVDDCKLLIGSRWNLKESWHRWIFRKLLNFVASIICGHYLIDLNSGFRIVDRELATGYEPILCDTFSFTTSMTMAFVGDNYKTVWIPIDVQPRRNGKSHVKLFRDGLITLWFIIYCGFGVRTRGIRRWIRHLHGQLMSSQMKGEEVLVA